MFGISDALVELRMRSKAEVVMVCLSAWPSTTEEWGHTLASSTPSPYGGSDRIEFRAPAISPL